MASVPNRPTVCIVTLYLQYKGDVLTPVSSGIQIVSEKTPVFIVHFSRCKTQFCGISETLIEALGLFGVRLSI